MIKKLLGLPLIVSAMAVSSVQAAPVAIDSMFVDSASVSLSAGSLGSASASTTLPSVEITMGSYQPTIFSIDGARLDLNIYSTSGYGAPAPTGIVDADTGTITVDFSSLRASVTYISTGSLCSIYPASCTYSFDMELWPLTTTLDYGTYNPVNGGYTVGWNELISIDVSPYLSVPGATLDVSLSGTLTTIPLPAAAWLFGSGLIALFGFAKSRKTQN